MPPTATICLPHSEGWYVPDDIWDENTKALKSLVFYDDARPPPVRWQPGVDVWCAPELQDDRPPWP
eukprot:7381440-Prymnesium_polylepis.4